MGNIIASAATQAIGVIVLAGAAWWLIASRRGPLLVTVGALCGLLAVYQTLSSPQLMIVLAIAAIAVSAIYAFRAWNRRQRASRAPFCAGCGHDAHRGASCTAQGCRCRG